ncbi:MAG: response regulator [Lachnospiraceae bacterium]|jgi:signal transduction histidine kinase/ActR/RegA family two-component response regulator|nr:response regulator [Lachnospiraceae bacterium]
MKKTCEKVFELYLWHIIAIAILVVGMAMASINFAGTHKDINQLIIGAWVVVAILVAALCHVMMKGAKEQALTEERNQAKSRYVARISYEMRTPMSAIIAMSEIARQSNDPAKIAYCLEQINDASHYLFDIVKNILDMSRIETGKITANNSDFSVAELMNRSVAALAYKIAEKHQELIIYVDGKVPNAIVTDMQLLTQIIIYLLSNSHEYTPAGGRIRISVESTKKSGVSHTLRFSVSDNGVCLNEDLKEKIGKSNADAIYGRTGLGLDIAHHIATLLGGKIWVEPEAAECGSRFIFEFDVDEGEKEDIITIRVPYYKKAMEQPLQTSFPGKRILFAEDIEVNRVILRELLADTGVMIEIATNGREAVEMFTANPDKYDLIFMDIQMPEMDGYTATQKIRELGTVQARNIPIVAMTANVFKEDAEHCLRIGMNGHLGKPIDKSEVLRTMQEFFVNP